MQIKTTMWYQFLNEEDIRPSIEEDENQMEPLYTASGNGITSSENTFAIPVSNPLLSIYLGNQSTCHINAKTYTWIFITALFIITPN